MEKPSERELFGLSGPTFLTAVDWNNSNHRRSIAASLVQGVYIHERDRRQIRQGPQALAPPWWEFFNFRLIQTLIDDHDLSHFGAIFEFNNFPYLYNSYVGQKPPQYVIAFRGTINKSGNRAQDFKLDLHCILNNLEKSRRIQIGMESVHGILSRFGPANVWLAGHSLGSSIALHIGRQMARDLGFRLETYLFNPPFISPPIERIKNQTVKLGLRLANSVVTAGLALAANGGKITKDIDPFVVLSSWIPYLFLNPDDHICSEYIGYFEHREKMESIGVGMIGKLATRHSIGSIVKGDREAAHLIPSAYLSINCNPGSSFNDAHGIHQWWRPDLDLKYKFCQYK